MYYFLILDVFCFVLLKQGVRSKNMIFIIENSHGQNHVKTLGSTPTNNKTSKKSPRLHVYICYFT